MFFVSTCQFCLLSGSDLHLSSSWSLIDPFNPSWGGGDMHNSPLRLLNKCTHQLQTCWLFLNIRNKKFGKIFNLKMALAVSAKVWWPTGKTLMATISDIFFLVLPPPFFLRSKHLFSKAPQSAQKTFQTLSAILGPQSICFYFKVMQHCRQWASALVPQGRYFLSK